MRPTRLARPFSALLTVSLIALIVGIAGRAWAGGSVTAVDAVVPAATATRQAELTEVARLQTEVAALRTQVAELRAPTLTPSPTPTATPVPPAPMNQPLQYANNWTITIIDVTKTPTVSGNNQSKTATEGTYVLISLTAINNGTERRDFPYLDFVLRDERGRVFEPANFESLLVSDTLQTVPPSIPTNTAIVFNVTTDVGESFILESRKDPTFRVQLKVVLRG